VTRARVERARHRVPRAARDARRRASRASPNAPSARRDVPRVLANPPSGRVRRSKRFARARATAARARRACDERPRNAGSRGRSPRARRAGPSCGSRAPFSHCRRFKCFMRFGFVSVFSHTDLHAFETCSQHGFKSDSNPSSISAKARMNASGCDIVRATRDFRPRRPCARTVSRATRCRAGAHLRAHGFPARGG